mmetsp:Transcript_34244/g.99446  ORF Transcript_34244/g.99446 Transcript_34244/m.99446 type:complete len:292 (-) Transcript_34244:183-1058(-)
MRHALDMQQGASDSAEVLRRRRNKFELLSINGVMHNAMREWIGLDERGGMAHCHQQHQLNQCQPELRADCGRHIIREGVCAVVQKAEDAAAELPDAAHGHVEGLGQDAQPRRHSEEGIRRRHLGSTSRGGAGRQQGQQPQQLRMQTLRQAVDDRTCGVREIEGMRECVRGILECVGVRLAQERCLQSLGGGLAMRTREEALASASSRVQARGAVPENVSTQGNCPAHGCGLRLARRQQRRDPRRDRPSGAVENRLCMCDAVRLICRHGVLGCEVRDGLGEVHEGDMRRAGQ